MRIAAIALLVFIFLSDSFTSANSKELVDEKEMELLAKEIAKKFNYYDEISSRVPNYLKGEKEFGGQCGDYAIAFVNEWNKKHANENEAFLVIQQQGIDQVPDGIYRVIGKDQQKLPFLKGRTTSMIYIWNNILGIGHPDFGGYIIELKNKAHVASHFGLKNWQNNGPHVWVIIGDTSVDPTYADFGNLPIIGKDQFTTKY